MLGAKWAGENHFTARQMGKTRRGRQCCTRCGQCCLGPRDQLSSVSSSLSPAEKVKSKPVTRSNYLPSVSSWQPPPRLLPKLFHQHPDPKSPKSAGRRLCWCRAAVRLPDIKLGRSSSTPGASKQPSPLRPLGFCLWTEARWWHPPPGTAPENGTAINGHLS